MGKSEETRNYIIEKAAPIFNRHGYEGTSMARLTKAIDMTKGAIYGNFKDKNEIAIAAFDHNFSNIIKQIRAMVGQKENANDKLIAFANFYLEQYQEISQNGGCPILNAAVDSDFVHPGLKKRVSAALDTWMNSVARIIYDGIKRGEINRNTRPEQFASVFVSLIEGGIMLSRTTGSTTHLSRNIDHITYLVNSELRV